MLLSDELYKMYPRLGVDISLVTLSSLTLFWGLLLTAESCGKALDAGKQDKSNRLMRCGKVLGRSAGGIGRARIAGVWLNPTRAESPEVQAK